MLGLGFPYNSEACCTHPMEGTGVTQDVQKDRTAHLCLSHRRHLRRMMAEFGREVHIGVAPRNEKEEWAETNSSQRFAELDRNRNWMVTDNIETDLDITNGVRGEIVDIILDSEEPPRVPAGCRDWTNMLFQFNLQKQYIMSSFHSQTESSRNAPFDAVNSP